MYASVYVLYYRNLTIDYSSRSAENIDNAYAKAEVSPAYCRLSDRSDEPCLDSRSTTSRACSTRRYLHHYLVVLPLARRENGPHTVRVKPVFGVVTKLC